MTDLFEQLLKRPPSPDREFTCRVCGRTLPGARVVLDEEARAFCRSCVGRLP